jgi:hypothetical protein
MITPPQLHSCPRRIAARQAEAASLIGVEESQLCVACSPCEIIDVNRSFWERCLFLCR